jgi:general secretion pathway protein D
LHVIRLRNADPTTMAEQLLTLRDDMPANVEEDPAAGRGGLRGLDFHVVAEPATRSLLVRSAPEAYGPVFDTVRTLDVMPPSVRIEVTVATIGFDDRLELDVNAFIPTLTNPKQPDDVIASVTSRPGGANPTLVDTSRPFTAAFTRAPLLLTFFDPITGTPIVLPPIPRESFSITLDGRTVNTEILLRPQLLVVSGEEHEIFSGDNIPVPVASPGTATSGEEGEGSVATPIAQVRQNIERYDVGTSVRVTPTVGQEGSVSLQMDVLVSRLEPSQAGPVEEVGPSIREIEIASRVRLRHGELAVLATESQPITQSLVTGVPWLMDIPWLGVLFRATTEQTMKRGVLVTVEAEILRPESRELARRLAVMLGPLDPFEREAP